VRQILGIDVVPDGLQGIDPHAGRAIERHRRDALRHMREIAARGHAIHRFGPWFKYTAPELT
jgi:hypothetical protein